MSKAKGTNKEQVSQWSWKKHKTCILGESNHTFNGKIAGFDMDSTIIETKSGAKFAKNADDWVYWNECVPKKMRQLEQQGYKIVIFTNQKGISTGATKAQDIQKKIQTLAADMKINIYAVIATQDDEFRKPGTKMWELFVSENGGKADLEKSFYCGDAAGRKEGKKKDFSDSDLKFALNVGIEFKTPENFYLGDKKKVEVQGFNPKSIPQQGKLFSNSDDKDVTYVDKQMVIFCGSPGAGKSTFWQTYMPKYERVNRDNLKTKEKCYKVAQGFIKQGKSVVIDNTNPKVEDRKYFLELAKKYNFKARCFFFKPQKQICFHNDYQRVANDKRKHLSGKAGSIPIHSWYKYLQEPALNEGFYEIKKVNFLAKFKSDEDKKFYHSFSKK